MDRVKNCRDKFTKLFGGEPVQNEGADPEFMRILQRFIFGEVSYSGSLDDRTRELVTITVLTVNQTLPQLKAHVGACLNSGISPVEVRETVYQCAPFAGFPKTLNAIAAMNEVFAAAGITLPLEDCAAVTESDRFERGLALQRPVCGGGAKSALWRRILADVLNLPVTVCANVQGPAYGGAILAMTGCGEYASVRSACQSVVKYGETCAPDPARAAAYERKYGVFKRLYPALKDISL